MKNVLVVGTLDTKGREMRYILDEIRAAGGTATVANFGVFEPDASDIPVDFTAADVAKVGGATLEELRSGGEAGGARNHAMEVMMQGLTAIMEQEYEAGRLGAVLGFGGSSGSSVVGTAMQVLPVGVPKVMVSTVGGGDVSAYAGTKDITFVPSIVDVAGINRISRIIYANAAGAIAGMTKVVAPPAAEEKPLIAASMFGNTTEAVGHARGILESAGYEVLVFHATGTGGKTMESLIADGYITASLDMTTTELADHVCGGVFSAGPERCLAASRAGIPAVLVPGCVDMCNFGGIDTVPEKFRGRQLYQWNPNVTLLRTNVEENVRMGEMLAAAANAARGPVAVLLPLKGVSMLDSPGGAFWDPEADQACYDTLKHHLRPGIRVIEMDNNINDPEFATCAANTLLDMVKR